jgi:hypothetical protein
MATWVEKLGLRRVRSLIYAVYVCKSCSQDNDIVRLFCIVGSERNRQRLLRFLEVKEDKEVTSERPTLRVTLCIIRSSLFGFEDRERCTRDCYCTVYTHLSLTRRQEYLFSIMSDFQH